MVKLKVIKPFFWEGKRLNSGEVIEVKKDVVNDLIQLGFVEFINNKITLEKEFTPEKETKEEKKYKQRKTK